MSDDKHGFDVPMENPLKVAMVLFPGMTLLDHAGPEAALSFHAKLHLVWETIAPITTDSGTVVMPNMTFDACPDDLDILFVPGGMGTADAMANPRLIAFLERAGATAGYVTSVCSGSIILGMAGLMRGYKATTHWSSLDMLEMVGAQAVEARVVVDRNRVSGGGVTAGIDFGLTLLALLRGEDAARLTQLAMEYDPQPPFLAGSPKGAGERLTGIAFDIVRPTNDRMRDIARRYGTAEALRAA